MEMGSNGTEQSLSGCTGNIGDNGKTVHNPDNSKRRKRTAKATAHRAKEDKGTTDTIATETVFSLIIEPIEVSEPIDKSNDTQPLRITLLSAKCPRCNGKHIRYLYSRNDRVVLECTHPICRHIFTIPENCL